MSKGGGVNIPSNYTVKVGSDGSVIHVDSDLDNIHIAEIAPINTNVAVTQPIVTQSTVNSTAAVGLKLEPIKIEPLKVTTDSNSVIDLKPLAIDSCQTLKIAPLPPIKVEQPYSQHFGITYMGVELWGVNISGKSEAFVHSPAKPHHFTAYAPEPHERRGEAGPSIRPAAQPPPSGLRVRVK